MLSAYMYDTLRIVLVLLPTSLANYTMTAFYTIYTVTAYTMHFAHM
jgi:hypothetical protein